MSERSTALLLRITRDADDTNNLLTRIAERWKLLKTDSTEYEVYTTGPTPSSSSPNPTYTTNHDSSAKAMPSFQLRSVIKNIAGK